MSGFPVVMCLVCFLALVLPAQEGYEELRLAFEQDVRPLNTFEGLSEAQPENPWVWHFLGLSADECGLESRAEEAFKRALSLDDRQAWHWQAMAGHWEGRHLWEQAASCLKRALELEQRPGARRGLEQRWKHVTARAELRREQARELHQFSGRLGGMLGAGLLLLCLLGWALLHGRLDA